MTLAPRSASLVVTWEWFGAIVTMGGADPAEMPICPVVGVRTGTLGDSLWDSPANDPSFSVPGGAVACFARERRAAAKEDDDVGDGALAPAVVVSGFRGVLRPRGGTVAVVLTPLLLKVTPPSLLMVILLLLLLLLLTVLALLTPAAAAAAATAAAAAEPGGRR